MDGCATALGVLLVFAALFGLSWGITALIVMVLWNVIVPAFFGGATITFIQALAGSFLLTIIGRLLGFGARKESK